jgi:hypothetical protein
MGDMSLQTCRLSIIVVPAADNDGCLMLSHEDHAFNLYGVAEYGVILHSERRFTSRNSTLVLVCGAVFKGRMYTQLCRSGAAALCSTPGQ